MASKIMGYRPILLPASCDAGKNKTSRSKNILNLKKSFLDLKVLFFSFGGTFSFSNCHIIRLDNGSLVLIVYAYGHFRKTWPAQKNNGLSIFLFQFSPCAAKRRSKVTQLCHKVKLVL
jgi:hypothetical protein